eukprot:366097-Chlamydomonas_euryale.AAC.29
MVQGRTHIHRKKCADSQQPDPLVLKRGNMQSTEGLCCHHGCQRQEAERHVSNAEQHRKPEPVQRQRPLHGNKAQTQGNLLLGVVVAVAAWTAADARRLLHAHASLSSC